MANFCKKQWMFNFGQHLDESHCRMRLRKEIQSLFIPIFPQYTFQTSTTSQFSPPPWDLSIPGESLARQATESSR
jgi:hypothetical protein